MDGFLTEPKFIGIDVSKHFGVRLALTLLIGIALGGCQTQPPLVAEWDRPTNSVDGDDSGQSTFPIDRDTRVVGELQRVQVRPNDTLLDIARQFDIGYEEIAAANPQIDPWLPRTGTTVVIPSKFILPDAPHTGIVLNLAALRLFYYPPAKANQRQTVITHPIGIGREGWQTPMGVTNVVAKVKNPRWIVPPSIRAEHAKEGDPLPEVVLPGPDNPLGNFAFRLGLPSYLIHGTNKPSGIGMRVSHGCIQLFPEDISRLFKKVPVGTPVRIVNQPYLAAVQDGTVYLETHTPLEEDRRKLGKDPKIMRRIVVHALKAAHQPDGTVDWQKASRVSNEAMGIPLPVNQNSQNLTESLARLPVLTLPPAPGVESPTTSPGWYVNAGAFKNEGNARKLTAMITHMGPPIPARYVPVSEGHQVLAGPFPNKRLAITGARRIKTNFGADTEVVPPGS